MLRNFGGYEVKTEGDAFMVAFQTAAAAVKWCLSVQLQLLEADWPKEILESTEGASVYDDESDQSTLLYRGISVRMGIHYGSPICEMDPITKRMDYFGTMVNRSARICGAAGGGQVFISGEVYSSGLNLAISGSEKDRMSLYEYEVFEIGETKLKGLENPEFIYALYPKKLGGRHKFYTSATSSTGGQSGINLEVLRELQAFCWRLESLAADMSVPLRSDLQPIPTITNSSIKNTAELKEKFDLFVSRLSVMTILIFRYKNCFNF